MTTWSARSRARSCASASEPSHVSTCRRPTAGGDAARCPPSAAGPLPGRTATCGAARHRAPSRAPLRRPPGHRVGDRPRGRDAGQTVRGPVAPGHRAPEPRASPKPGVRALAGDEHLRRRRAPTPEPHGAERRRRPRDPAHHRRVPTRRAEDRDRGVLAAVRRKEGGDGSRPSRGGRRARQIRGRSPAPATRRAPTTAGRRSRRRCSAPSTAPRAPARAVRRGRQPGRARHDRLHHRGDEDDELGARRGVRDDRRGLPGERGAGRVRRAAVPGASRREGDAGGDERVFVANRGEIALRIVRACRQLGLESVVCCSDVDRDGLAARSADRAVCIGPGPAARSYLRAELVVQAALGTGCDAIHPGYGFLSESPRLALLAREHGVVFVGPPPEVMELAGDKLRARAEAARAGLPVLPGQGVQSPARRARELAERDRLSGAGQGRRGRRRPRDQARARRRRAVRAARTGPQRGGSGVRRRARVCRALHPRRPAHRGAGRRRRARVRDPPGRARLLGAAPLSEGDRGGARAVAFVLDT